MERLDVGLHESNMLNSYNRLYNRLYNGLHRVWDLREPHKDDVTVPVYTTNQICDISVLYSSCVYRLGLYGKLVRGCSHQTVSIFTARRSYASAVLVIAILSVGLSI